MVLYFGNSFGRTREIARPETIEEAHKEMKKFMNDRNFKSYYTRVWEESGMLKFDVGSHTEFFYLDGINFDDYREEVRNVQRL